MKGVTMKNFKTAIKMAMVCSLFLVVVNGSQAATLEGTIQGFTCLKQKELCPVDRSDPRLSSERNFVISGKDDAYHFLPNIDRSILTRNILKKARVTGQPMPRYNSVKVEKLEVFKEGKWREIWSREAEEEALEEQYGH